VCGYSVITHQAKAELSFFQSLRVSFPGNQDARRVFPSPTSPAWERPAVVWLSWVVCQLFFNINLLKH